LTRWRSAVRARWGLPCKPFTPLTFARSGVGRVESCFRFDAAKLSGADAGERLEIGTDFGDEADAAISERDGEDRNLRRSAELRFVDALRGEEDDRRGNFDLAADLGLAGFEKLDGHRQGAERLAPSGGWLFETGTGGNSGPGEPRHASGPNGEKAFDGRSTPAA